MPKFPPPPRIAQNRVRIGVRRGRTHLTVGADDLGRDDVVAREPALATDPPVAAAERESGDTRVGYDASRCGKPEGLRFPVDVAPDRSALHACQSRFAIDVDATHERKVDHHPAVRA